jgi:hypothetical protein
VGGRRGSTHRRSSRGARGDEETTEHENTHRHGARVSADVASKTAFLGQISDRYASACRQN